MSTLPLSSNETQPSSNSRTSQSAPGKGRRGKQFGALLTSQDASNGSAGPTGSRSQQSSVSPSNRDGSSKSISRSQSRPNHSSKTHPSKQKQQPTLKFQQNQPTYSRQKNQADRNTSPSTQSQKGSIPNEVSDSNPLNQSSGAQGEEPENSVVKPSSLDSSEFDASDLCLICAEPIKCYALGVCSHRTCHVCTIRMRALYKKRDCALCKTELKDVILTTDAQSRFDSYDLSSFEFKDDHLSIYCETFEQLNELLAYLKFNCPHPNCSSVLSNWKALQAHTRSVHSLSLCDLCCSNKKVFAHEHTLFTTKALNVHMKQGSVGIGKGIRGSRNHQSPADDVEEPVTQEEDDGFKGHPKCGFCNTHFYDDDQLYQHCRDAHEQCFICVRNGVGRWQYYLDYKHLESHFRDDHFLCSQPTCLQARFVVYPTALELQAHQIEAHGAEMGMRAIKDARKLETHFVYESGAQLQAQMQSAEREAREQRAGRGIMVMDITPINGASSSSLSNPNRIVPGLAPPRESNNERRSGKGKSKSAPLQEPEEANVQSSSNADDLEPRPGTSNTDPQVVQRHTALIQRVAEAVDGNTAKITSFKAAVRTYRNNETTASGFIDTLCSIFDHRSEIIGSILSNLLDLLDTNDESKGQLLEKWLDLKLEQTQYPSLASQSSKNAAVTSGSNLWLHNSSGLDSLKASSWIRQQPKYHKLLEGPSKGPNRGVPGLPSKASKSVGQPSTPWASGSSNKRAPVITNPRPHPTPSSHSFSSTVAKGSQNANTQFPSLPKKSIVSKPHLNTNQIWQGGVSNGMVAAISQGNPTQAMPGNQQATRAASSVQSSSQSMPSGGNKKPKKTILFTNSR